VRGELPAEHDLSTNELFVRVLDELRDVDGERLDALVALHGRPTQNVIDRSLAMCSSEEPFERIVGLQVLRELKHQLVDRRTMWEPVEPVVVSLASADSDPRVVQWAISCLGYQPSGQSALMAVLGRADHPDSRVRLAVAAAIPGLIDPDLLDPAPVEALVRLSEDDDADVRSYALMGLVDDLGLTSARRKVVEARLTDPDEQIRRFARNALDESINRR
jgi:HEAT repeat protein